MKHTHAQTLGAKNSRLDWKSIESKALTLNKAISTSLKYGCYMKGKLRRAPFTPYGWLWVFFLIVLYFLSDGCGILEMYF